MGSDTIDKLIFALGGDLTQLNKAYAEAEAGAQKTGTSIKANFSSGFKDAAAAATQHSNEIKKALGDVDAAVKSTHGSTATATREFRALFDELSSGRTRQTPGTLAIIATRVFGISGATLAWSVALAAIPVGFAVAAAMASNSLAKIDEALKRTGNQAGVTVDQIRRIAESGIPGLSVNSAQGVLSILASRGNIDPSQLANVARATPGFARASGTDNDKAATELEKLLADPAKGADELNKEFKLLDVSTTRQIEDLEASGRTADAQAVLVKALNDRFDGLAKSSWSLAEVFGKLGTGISNFWTHTGQFFSGNGQTDIQKAASLTGANAQIDAQLRQYNVTYAGKAGIDAARAMMAANPHDYGQLGVGDSALGNLVASYNANAQQIKELNAKITKDTGAAILGRAHADQNSAVGFGLKIADQYDEQGEKAKKLQEQLSGLNIALDNAIGPNAKFRDEILKERDAVALALKNQKTPAQIAAEEAADQRRVAGAPATQRDTLRAQLAAKRELERNLSDPRTAPFAQSIYDSQMGVASLNNKDINKAAADAKRQGDNLKALQSEATAARSLAAAYEISDAAGLKAKATGEIDVEITKDQIAAKDRLAAVAAKVAAAYAQADAAIGKQIQTLKLANAALMGERSAGGNPALLAAAKRQSEVEAAVKDLSPEDAARRRPQLLAQYEQRDSSTALLSGNASVYGAKTNLSNLQAQAGVFSPDALRQLQVMQSTMDELVKTGLDPASADFKNLYNQLLPFNLQISDLSDKLQQARQAASDFASDITGPVEQFLEKGGSIRKMFADVFGNLGKTTIHDFIVKPAQKMLESGIGSLLGVGLTAPDGSLTNPYYVMMAPQGALLNGSSGGLGGIVSSIFSGTGGGTGILGGIGSFISGIFGGGKASGGNIDPGKFYAVGEKGPEILGPGVSGAITPLTAPNTNGSNPGTNMSVATHMTATIVVQGNGDKELQANMRAGAEAITTQMIEQNNRDLSRTQRPSLIAKNKRALP